MWNEIELVIKEKAETLLNEITDAVKNRLIRVYSAFLFSIASVFIFCYALSSLFTKLAYQLDAVGVFVWTPSMTLYLLVMLGSLAGLKLSMKGVQIDRRLSAFPREMPIERLSQKRRSYGKKSRKRKSP